MVGKIAAAQKKATDPALNKAAWQKLGEELAPLARVTATGTKLGSDAAFTRGSSHASKPWFNAPLEARPSPHKNGYGVTFGRTKESAGPWTVAEFGRNRGNAAGFSGPGISAKTGLTLRNKDGAVRKVRKRKGRRWNGTTEGFDAWTKAAAAMADAAPPRVQTHFAKTFLGVFK